MEGQDFEIFAGDGCRFRITLSDESVSLANPGSKAWFTVKAKLSDPDSAAMLQATLGFGLEVGEAPHELMLILTPEQTRSFGGGRTLIYDVQISVGGAPVETVAYGQLRVLPDVTQALS